MARERPPSGKDHDIGDGARGSSRGLGVGAPPDRAHWAAIHPAREGPGHRSGDSTGPRRGAGGRVGTLKGRFEAPTLRRGPRRRHRPPGEGRRRGRERRVWAPVGARAVHRRLPLARPTRTPSGIPPHDGARNGPCRDRTCPAHRRVFERRGAIEGAIGATRDDRGEGSRSRRRASGARVGRHRTGGHLHRLGPDLPPRADARRRAAIGG